MTVYGYIRVSTNKQDENNFKNWILNKANDLKIGPVEFIVETVSGKKDWKKRAIGLAFETMVKGDSIITFEYSRIGRNAINSIHFLAECDRKGIKVYPGELVVDPNDAKSNMEVCVQAMTSQFEREHISRRTKTSLEMRRRSGMVIGGRKEVMKLDHNGKGIYRNEKNEEDIHQLLAMGVKIYVIAKKYGVCDTNMGQYIKKWDLKKPKDQRDPNVIKKAVDASNAASAAYLRNQAIKTGQV